MARVTKSILETKLNNVNGILEQTGHPLRLWHDGGAYGQGPRLYFHKPGEKHLQERWATGRQRIGLCWEWADAYGQGAYAVLKATEGTEGQRLKNLAMRLQQVVNMTSEAYVESTRPTVELPEVPWIEPDKPRLARLEAIQTISRELCNELEHTGILGK